MVYNETWDETKPAGSRARTLGDDDIREFKRAIRERLAEDHEFLANESGDNVGYHRKATLIDIVSDPLAVDGCVVFYAKTVDGKLDLFYRNAEGINQLTVNGAIQNGLWSLDDVTITSVADRQILYYNAATSQWINGNLKVSANGYAVYKA